MIKIAIVEDERKDVDRIKRFILQFSEDENLAFSIECFKQGINFIEDYNPDYDIIFMDIDMPNMSGLETAKRLRRLDSTVCLIFVTNMAQYAINGYEVDALDFMVKPVEYSLFCAKMKRALASIKKHKERRNRQIVLREGKTRRRIDVKNVIYVEVYKHDLIYHLTNGDITVKGTMYQIEDDYRKLGFYRCFDSYLVNLNNILDITSTDVTLSNGTKLPISRRKRKEILEVFAEYKGEM